jgi:hypothetical protein
VTKKDYQAIAAAIRRVRIYESGIDENTVEKIIKELITVFNADNGRFDPDRFYKASAL